MKFFEKIENAINYVLIKLGDLILRAVPAPIKKFAEKRHTIRIFLKQLPSVVLKFLITCFKATKEKLLAINYKEATTKTYQKVIAQYSDKGPKGITSVKNLLLFPIHISKEWLKGLSPAQALLLLSFTGASILSVIGIGYSSQKLSKASNSANRNPASTEIEITYDRPDYYKKQTKFFEVNNFRLPVYVAQVNEIRSLDLDFIVTLSNRFSKDFLESHDYQFRDYLILQVEPSVASFPLEEEGKEIIRKKLISEINDFLKLHEIEGEALELKITYVLAN